jgi:hypothetical protein
MAADSSTRAVVTALAADLGNPNLAPPGWYLLTIVDHQRRPPRGRWVQLAPGS